MSYPLTLQPLVIEDEVKTKDAYEAIFEIISGELSKSLPFLVARPCFAFSHEQPVALLDSSKIFHVVILDLRLPERQGLPEVQDLDLGLDLLDRCINRDRYPIPALLVISGHLGAADQIRIQDTLRNNFWYGRPLAKGDAFLEGQISNGCREALRYAGVGIHLRDAGEEQYPMRHWNGCQELAPRTMRAFLKH